MKVRIFILVLALFLFLGLSLSPAQATSTPVYLGQTTWSGTITAGDNVGQTFTCTGGITRLGDTYYEFQGYVNMPSGVFVIAGGGVLINGQVIFSVTTSQTHSDSNWHDTGVMRVTLDQSTLNGTSYEIGHDYDTGTPQYGERYTATTLTRTGPMIPLTPDSTAATSLLLLQ
jgi:hypothetical protein